MIKTSKNTKYVFSYTSDNIEDFDDIVAWCELKGLERLSGNPSNTIIDPIMKTFGFEFHIPVYEKMKPHSFKIINYEHFGLLGSGYAYELKIKFKRNVPKHVLGEFKLRWN